MTDEKVLLEAGLIPHLPLVALLQGPTRLEVVEVVGLVIRPLGEGGVS